MDKRQIRKQGCVGASEERAHDSGVTGLIVASLMLCWLPTQIRRVMMAALPKSSWTSNFFRSYVTLSPVADTFFYLSSVINPFLYNLSSRQFREVFVQVLRCRLTIEHANKRTLANAPASRISARSLQPLLRSLRRNKDGRSAKAQTKPFQRFRWRTIQE
ncbi:G-protein coupled receptor 39 [Takifugu flavidus]|uniref:G-protein coupled receptor 39 n=1 Tax=Takifugu flavidus TaxID=433684 RepID=A0A5C6PKC9_9TELE|nr:G-protein coupled receptor 39 [Takifugu flavidus]